ATFVFDNNGLAKVLAHFCSNQAGHCICWAAGGPAYDHADCRLRVVSRCLRECSGSGQAQRGNACRSQKLSAGKSEIHGCPLLKLSASNGVSDEKPLLWVRACRHDVVTSVIFVKPSMARLRRSSMFRRLIAWLTPAVPPTAAA